MTNGNLAPASWDDAIVTVEKMLDSYWQHCCRSWRTLWCGGKFLTFWGTFLKSSFSSLALKDLYNSLGSEALCTEEFFASDATGTYLRYVEDFLMWMLMFLYPGLTTSWICIAGVEGADLVLLIGGNPGFVAPVFNSRLRKCWIHNEPTNDTMEMPAIAECVLPVLPAQRSRGPMSTWSEGLNRHCLLMLLQGRSG